MSAYPIVRLEDYLVSGNARSMLVRVNGSEMEKAGLKDGDLIVVERQAEIPNGAIVAVHTNAGIVVRYLAKFTEGWLTSSADGEVQPAEHPALLGVMTGLIRRTK